MIDERKAPLIAAIDQYEAAVTELNAEWDGSAPAEESLPTETVERYKAAEAALAILLPGTDVLGWHNAVKHEGKLYARCGGGRVAAVPVDSIEDAGPDRGLDRPQVVLGRPDGQRLGADRVTDIEAERIDDGVYSFKFATNDGSILAVMLDAALANDLWCDLKDLLDGNDAIDFDAN